MCFVKLLTKIRAKLLRLKQEIVIITQRTDLIFHLD